ncbi:MAG: cytochrome b/b6 domain-containing protein [Burkholderiaceae bacterium]|nr:cytochrome b/b6 domain-containing protein [Roseateles sp.]MBV8470743.1 cytochrome b/b6 domain-containing protein [Burkholderiaceae bacterium]
MGPHIPSPASLDLRYPPAQLIASAASLPQAPQTPQAAASADILWDAPTRLFHWSLVGTVGTALVTGWLGGDWMELHGKAGLGILGLLSFRIAWGVLGGRHARFASFWPSPSRIQDYLRGRWRGRGHNPLGALSVLAMLGLLLFQALTGLFGNDEIAFTGPLADRVSESLSLKLTAWHQLNAKALYGLLALHLLAIAFYVGIKRRRLIAPMITGRAEAAGPHSTQSPPAVLGARRLWLHLGVALGFAGIAVALPNHPDWIATLTSVWTQVTR